MTLAEMTARLLDEGGFVPGKRLRLDFGPAGSIYLDGIAGDVNNGPGDADTTLSIGWDDWIQLAKGALDPVGAYMSGKLKIDGSISDAMQLGSVLSAIRG